MLAISSQYNFNVNSLSCNANQQVSHAGNVALLRLGSQHGTTGPINGLLVRGIITSSNLVGPLKGKYISDLVKDMLDGNIYLRVSTIKLPLEIIGKITPAE